MGVVSSKSPLERRNTVLRRSQRKSIHGFKAKTDKIAKDIKKLKGDEASPEYGDLKARVEYVERQLRASEKTLQPEVRNVHRDALRRVEECYRLLDDKAEENREEAPPEEEKEEVNDDVFVEEEPDRGRTVELNLVQVELIDQSPQLNKRASMAKIGVPVMPESMMEALQWKSEESQGGVEKEVAAIKQQIEKIEVEISQFVGKRNGKFYNKIKEQLEKFSKELTCIPLVDEDIVEQVKLCENYIASCLSFLDEKAVDRGDDVDDDSDEDESDQLPKYNEMDQIPNLPNFPNNNFSPRTIRTTFI